MTVSRARWGPPGMAALVALAVFVFVIALTTSSANTGQKNTPTSVTLNAQDPPVVVDSANGTSDMLNITQDMVAMNSCNGKIVDVAANVGLTAASLDNASTYAANNIEEVQGDAIFEIATTANTTTLATDVANANTEGAYDATYLIATTIGQITNADNTPGMIQGKGCFGTELATTDFCFVVS